MARHFEEIDKIICLFKNDLNCPDQKLRPKLKTVSKEAKDFIINFCEKWDDAIVADNSILFDYEKTAKFFRNIQEQYAPINGYSRTQLCRDIEHFLYVQAREKNNDLHKSNASHVVVTDVEVLHYCFVYWRDLEDQC